VDGVARDGEHLDAALGVQVHDLDLPHYRKSQGPEIKKEVKSHA